MRIRPVSYAKMASFFLATELGERKINNPSVSVMDALKDSIKSNQDYLIAIFQGSGSYRRFGGAIYSGKVSWFLPNGKGTLLWPNGSAYTGEWKNGTFSGRVIHQQADGNCYTRVWINGKPCIAYPKKTEGSINPLEHKTPEERRSYFKESYERQLQDRSKHGPETLSWSNGNCYVGELENGRRHGQGIYCWTDDAFYEGQWKNGRKHGQGTYYSADGEFYKGEWKDGLKHGQGIYCWPGGDSYEGEWKDGQKHGQGTYSTIKGEFYKGEWFRGWPSKFKGSDQFTFDLQYDREQINAMSPKSPTGEIAVIFQSENDWNGAFGDRKQSCKLLADALSKIGGYECSIFHYSTIEKLKEQIEAISKKVDLVWVRAHGSGGSFDDYKGNVDTLAPLAEKLSQKSTIVIESCYTGREGLLADKLKQRLCAKGIDVSVIASEDASSYNSLNLKKLVEYGSIEVQMGNKNGEDTTRVYKCDKPIPEID